jgi:hypothetical protein
VHDADRCLNVGGNNLRAVNQNGVGRCRAVTFSPSTVLIMPIACLLSSWRGGRPLQDNMVGEQVDEVGLVLRLQEVGESTGGQGLEGLVGRGKEGERALT